MDNERKRKKLNKNKRKCFLNGVWPRRNNQRDLIECKLRNTNGDWLNFNETPSPDRSYKRTINYIYTFSLPAQQSNSLQQKRADPPFE